MNIEIDAKDVLEELIKKHFFTRALEWNYTDSACLQEQDPILHAKIVLLFPEVIEKNK